MKIRFTTLAELKKWLLTTTGIVLTSVTLMQDVQTIKVQAKSTAALYQALEYQPDFLPEGQYIVNYKELTKEDIKELDYSKMAFALSASMTLNNESHRKIGGFRELSKALSNFEASYILDKENPAYLIATFWIVEPLDPQELVELKSTLSKYAVIYGFNDGTGTINIQNTKVGKGMYAGLV